jgi:hypothetical protein
VVNRLSASEVEEGVVREVSWRCCCTAARVVVGRDGGRSGGGPLVGG